nr:immunoglobulin heavy chain junction region [Macaca mulatta]
CVTTAGIQYGLDF